MTDEQVERANEALKSVMLAALALPEETPGKRLVLQKTTMARAAISAMQPTPQDVPKPVRELIWDSLEAMRPYFINVEDDEVAACWTALRAIAGEEQT